MLTFAILSVLCTRPALNVKTESVTVRGHALQLKTVRISLRDYDPHIMLGHDRMGRVESLAAMASRHGAAAAINGTFFDAYTNATIRNADQTLITDGRMINLGRVGCVVGFAGFSARIERVRWTIEGSLNGNYRDKKWYAYWINRAPTSADAALLYTPEWGSETGFTDLQIVVDNGTVTKIATGSQVIPRKGFVLLLRGSEISLARRFKVGDIAEVRQSVTQGDTSGFWDQVQVGLGCGPMLVDRGVVDLHAESEGFTSPKILSISAARSALGITKDQTVILAVTVATVADLAEAMHQLGCQQAMNLDGGASSGLIVEGKAIRTPGREIANALAFIPKARPK